MERLEYEVVEADEGERADVVLGRHLAGVSRRVARRLGLEGRLARATVDLPDDGPRRIRPSQRVRAGDRLFLAIESASQSDASPSVEVLLETPEIVYVHKPTGMHTVAHSPGQPNCLSVLVQSLHPECIDASENPLEAGAVHRLDAETSGVVAFARSRPCWQAARAAFDRETVLKQYLAVCAPATWPPIAPSDALVGWLVEDEMPFDPLPGSGLRTSVGGYRIRAPLGRGSARGTSAVRLDGQRSTTLVRRVDGATAPSDRVVCLLRLLSGRRHQARVHLAWAGLPIEGDPLYGPGTTTAMARLGLHAHALDLSSAFDDHPVVVAPPPAAMAVD